MRVDEAGEERGVSEVECFSASGNGSLSADAADFSVGDDNQAWSRHSVALAIEHPRRLQHIGLACLCRLRMSGQYRDSQQSHEQPVLVHDLLPLAVGVAAHLELY